MAASPERDGAKPEATSLRTFLPLVWGILDRRLRWRFFATLALIGFGAVLSAVAPLAFKLAVDGLATGAFAAAGTAVAAYVALRFLSRLGDVGLTALYATIDRRIRRGLATHVYAHVLDLPHRAHIARKTGELDRTVADGLGGARSVLRTLAFSVFPVVIEGATIAAVLTTQGYRPSFLLILGGFALVYGLVFRRGYARQRDAYKAASKTDAEAAGVATDALLNHETVRLFCGERLALGQIDGALARGEAAWLAFTSTRFANALALHLVFVVALALVLAEAVRQVAAGEMTPGDFVLVNAYALQITGPIERLGFASLELVQGLGLVGRMRALMDEPGETQAAPAAGASAALPAGSGPLALAFQDVRFAYDERRPVLRGVTFEVPAGRTVAIVGPSGAGKSTLARLLFRLYEVDGGAIRVGGREITDLALASLRGAIAIVPQDTVLFNDTLFSNVAFGRPEAAREEVEAAARLAGLSGLIATLPDGWETVVGERGLKLSGGEKQRVAIARAVLKRPRLYVFDEATSALDTATERLIQANLAAASRGVTTLVIAHRLSTVVDADEILVLADGEVVERGRHRDLLARPDGRYAAMWAAQQRPDAARAMEVV